MGALALIQSSPATPTSRDQARLRFADVEIWLASHETLALPLHEVEVEQEQRGREIMRLLLQDHLDRRGSGEVGVALEVRTSATGEGPQVRRHGQKRHHLRHVLSIFGRLAVRRLAYFAAHAESVHPLDEAAWLPRRTFGYELQRRAVLGAVLGPFDEAIGRVSESTGLKLSKRSIEDLVREAAVDFSSFYEQRAPPSPKETAALLIGAADGKGVPMVRPEQTLRVVRRKKGKKANKKRIATVAAVFTQAPRVRTPEEVVESLFHEGPRLLKATPTRAPPEGKRVWASLIRNQIDVLTDVSEEIALRDPRQEKTVVLLVDGDRGLRDGFRAVVPRGIQILDLLHVLEKLWRMAYCFHEEGSDVAKKWVRKRALRVLRGEVSQVVKGIRQSATKRGLRGRDRKFVDRHTKYLLRNKDRMRYDVYLRRGFPIASGAVEGACKNLVKDRMERSGMRWTLQGAEALLQLRAAYLSGDFAAYWQYHVAAEQQRLYPSDCWRVVEE